MQPIHNPAHELRQGLESDISAFLKRGGKIKVEPLKKTPAKVSNQFSLNSSQKEFKEVQAKRKKDSNEVVEVKYSSEAGLYHIYQGYLRLSTKGYFSEQTARMQAAKLQEKINIELRMKSR